MTYLKLAAALAPLIVALLAQLGIATSSAQVETWLQLALWLAAGSGAVAPSIRAWLLYRDKAD